MKKSILACCLFASVALSACSVKTPAGTVHVEFNKDETSPEVEAEVAGKKVNLDFSSIESSVDKLLEDVDIPNGGTTEELKKFVYDNLSAMGIDLSSISAESAEELENAINTLVDEYSGSAGNTESSEAETSTEESGGEG